jgi:hypothetical protein
VPATTYRAGVTRGYGCRPRSADLAHVLLAWVGRHPHEHLENAELGHWEARTVEHLPQSSELIPGCEQVVPEGEQRHAGRLCGMAFVLRPGRKIQAPTGAEVMADEHRIEHRDETRALAMQHLRSSGYRHPPQLARPLEEADDRLHLVRAQVGIDRYGSQRVVTRGGESAVAPRIFVAKPRSGAPLVEATIGSVFLTSGSGTRTAYSHEVAGRTGVAPLREPRQYIRAECLTRLSHCIACGL